MTSQSDVALTVAFLRESTRIEKRGRAALAAVWLALANYDEADVETFERRARPLLDALQAAASAVAVGYLLTFVGERPDMKGFTLDQDLRGPFIGVWSELKRSGNRDEALKIGRRRASGLAQERVVLTEREATKRLDTSSLKTVGWRRVPQGSTCSWCVHIATQRYRSAESATFGHGHKGVNYCDCKIVPIYGKRDPGQVLGKRTLEQWKQAQNAEQPPAYFDVGGSSLAPAERPDV